MTFGHGKDSRLFLNETHQSGQIQSWTVEGGREFADVTVLTDGGMRWLPGQMVGKLTVNGLLDSTAGSLHQETIASLDTTAGLLWTVFPSGPTIGQPAFIAASSGEGYSLESTLTDAVKLTIEAQPDDTIGWGVSLHAHSAETADANGTAVDNAAASSAGGIASLHVTAFSGLTNAVIKVQHSTNNSVWSDLATFTTATGVTSQRSAVTGTVNRYLRSIVDVTGTGSVTYVCAFARF